MNKMQFLEECEKHDMYFAKIWDLGAIMHSGRTEESWFSDLCEDWWGNKHPSMAFLDLSDIEDLEDEDIAFAMSNQIAANKKFGYIAQLNIPRRVYLGQDFYQSGGLYSVPMFYGECMEDLWNVAVEFAEKQRKDELAVWVKKEKAKKKADTQPKQVVAGAEQQAVRATKPKATKPKK